MQETMAFAKVQKQERYSLTLLQRVAGNDRTAVKECLDTYGNLVWAMAKKFTPSIKEAEVLAREIFNDIWRYAGRYDSQASTEIYFVKLIARRHLIKRSLTAGQKF